ncbi:cutinase family protein, partial [Actinomycetospora sp.]|uniref:cutinase family protein n=1 Tax=Actinomycetospora sp. TaxID=1872135 RepID=UPI002F3EAC74
MAPDVRLELTHGPGGPGVLADGRALTVPPHASATDVGLAAARRHAARSGRDLLVEVVDGASVTTVSVGPQGFVTLVSAPPRPSAPSQPAAPDLVPPAPAEFATAWIAASAAEPPVAPPGCPAPDLPSPRTTTPPVEALSPWARPVPARSSATGRPVASLVVTALVVVAVVVGAVGTGVATLASSQALPGSCRPVTVYAVGGAGGASDVLRGVTDPLSSQFGEKISVVTVPPPPTGGSYASAESEAVSSLANAVGEHVEGCPTGALMLFGYSQGAQVAGDLASRVGTGLEPRVPANLIQAVGLFGDPARSPRTRAVPEGTTGQGALPPRAVGFGSLDARTIEICAPGDPVCDSPPDAAAPALEQAVASPVHGSYQQLPVAAGTTAPRWAAGSLGKVVAAIPTDAGPAKAPAGTTAQSGAVGTTTPGATGSSGTGAADSSTSGTGSSTTSARGADGVGTTTAVPESGDTYGEAGGAAAGPTVTAAPGSSETGSTADGAGAATRRSGSAGASSTVAPGDDGSSGSASGT